MKIIDLQTTPTAEILDQSCACLAAGGLLIYPTETVYGAGVDATNQAAVDKLLKYKSRREGKPLSIAVNSQKMAEKYVEINEQAQQFYDQFLPGPYTIISKTKNQVAQGVASEFSTIGIRWPDHELLNQLVAQYGRPITSTSANASGKKRPYSVQDILANLSQTQKEKIDLILDAGTLPPNSPSTVIDTTLSTPLTVRHADGQQPDETSLELISNNETETKQIAGKILLKNWEKIKKTGLIIGLDGQLGAGKTIFAKGIAKFLQIDEMITSPTYTYIKEYDYQRHQTAGRFYHLDVWKIDNQAQLETLEIPQLFSHNNVIAIEWWQQIKNFLLPLIEQQNLPLVELGIKVIDDHQRKIRVYEK